MNDTERYHIKALTVLSMAKIPSGNTLTKTTNRTQPPPNHQAPSTKHQSPAQAGEPNAQGDFVRGAVQLPPPAHLTGVGDPLELTRNRLRANG